MANFSPNMLKVYETCPRKYYYQYVEEIQVPRSSLPFEKGKKIHALANYYLQGVNISRIETALSDTEREVWNVLLENKFFQKDVLKSEYPISCKVSDFWIGGRLDAVVQDYQGYYILDYKTGSIPSNPQYDYQTMVYLLCLDKILKTQDQISFVYINLRDKKDYVIKFDDNLKKEYEEKIADICNKITKDTVYQYSCDDKTCSRCEYSKLCDRF